MSVKRTALFALLGAIIALGATLAADPKGDEPRGDSSAGGDRYAADCRILMATDNEGIPPTIFGRYPTKGTLTFLAVGEVLNGRLGATRLDGAKFALFGRAPGDWRHVKRFEALGIYMDEAATAEQRRALTTIFRSDELFHSERVTSLTTTRIKIDRKASGPLAETVARIGGDAPKGELTLRAMKGADGVNPVAVQNGFGFFDEKEPVALATASVRFVDRGRELVTTNGSGEVHVVRLRGIAHGAVDEK